MREEQHNKCFIASEVAPTSRRLVSDVMEETSLEADAVEAVEAAAAEAEARKICQTQCTLREVAPISRISITGIGCE